MSSACLSSTYTYLKHIHIFKCPLMTPLNKSKHLFKVYLSGTDIRHEPEVILILI